MKYTTKLKLLAAYEWCEKNDKSTEFMLEYMQQHANVDLDCVIIFLKDEAGFKKMKRNNELANNALKRH